MFERFTDRARKVMALANQSALRYNHEYIGTEHILLGLLREKSGVGAHALENLGFDFEQASREFDDLYNSRFKSYKRPLETTREPSRGWFSRWRKKPKSPAYTNKLPQTPRAKKVIMNAIEESRSLNHNYVGTEHVLLGLLREPEGQAGRIMLKMGLKYEQVREEVLNLLGTSMVREPVKQTNVSKETKKLINVFKLAVDEALRLNNNFGTEHILLGLLIEETGICRTILQNLQVKPDRILKELNKRIVPGETTIFPGIQPGAEQVEMVRALATQESQALKHNYVGCDHLLLGLLKLEEGPAWQVLTELGLDYEQVLEEVKKMSP